MFTLVLVHSDERQRVLSWTTRSALMNPLGHYRCQTPRVGLWRGGGGVRIFSGIPLYGIYSLMVLKMDAICQQAMIFVLTRGWAQSCSWNFRSSTQGQTFQKLVERGSAQILPKHHVSCCQLSSSRCGHHEEVRFETKVVGGKARLRCTLKWESQMDGCSKIYECTKQTEGVQAIAFYINSASHNEQMPPRRSAPQDICGKAMHKGELMQLNEGISGTDIQRLARCRMIENANGKKQANLGGTKEAYLDIMKMLKRLQRATRDLWTSIAPSFDEHATCSWRPRSPLVVSIVLDQEWVIFHVTHVTSGLYSIGAPAMNSRLKKRGSDKPLSFSGIFLRVFHHVYKSVFYFPKL